MSQTIIVDGKERELDLSKSWDRMVAAMNGIRNKYETFYAPVRSIDNHLRLNHELAKLIFSNDKPNNNFTSLWDLYESNEKNVNFEELLKPYMVEGTIFVMKKPRGFILEKVGPVLAEGCVDNEDIYQNWLDRMLEMNPKYLDRVGAGETRVTKADFEGYRTKNLGHILLDKKGKNLFVPKWDPSPDYEGKKIWNASNMEIYRLGALILTSKELINAVNRIYSSAERNYLEQGDKVTLELV